MGHSDLQQVRLNHRTGWWLTPVQDKSHNTASMLLLSVMHPFDSQNTSCYSSNNIYDLWTASQLLHVWFQMIPFARRKNLDHRTRGGRKGIDDGYVGISSFSRVGSFESTPCSWLLIRCWIRNLLTYGAHESTMQKLISTSKSRRNCNPSQPLQIVIPEEIRNHSYPIDANCSRMPS